MTEQNGNYYRKTGTHDFCGCEILPPPKYEIERIIIDHIIFHEKIKINGQQKENAFVAYFTQNPYTSLPFCLNSGNAKRLAKQTWNMIVEDGSECQGRIDLLHNIPVRLCRELTRDPSDGGQVYGLRISKLPPAEAPSAPVPKKKVITSDKVGVIVDWALKNKLTIDKIAEQYDFESAEVKQSIIDKIEDIPA